MNWSKVGILSPKEEPRDHYVGELDHCAICDRTLYVDDVREDITHVHGLGRVCVSCYLAEIESQDLQEAI